MKYRFYRSTKKAAGYKAAVTKKASTYTSTSGKKGTKYFYKVQVRVYDASGKLAAKTALKQCRCASRTWSKMLDKIASRVVGCGILRCSCTACTRRSAKPARLATNDLSCAFCGRRQGWKCLLKSLVTLLADAGHRQHLPAQARACGLQWAAGHEMTLQPFVYRGAGIWRSAKQCLAKGAKNCYNK